MLSRSRSDPDLPVHRCSESTQSCEQEKAWILNWSTGELREVTMKRGSSTFLLHAIAFDQISQGLLLPWAGSTAYQSPHSCFVSPARRDLGRRSWHASRIILTTRRSSHLKVGPQRFLKPEHLTLHHPTTKLLHGPHRAVSTAPAHRNPVSSAANACRNRSP